jgi:hypothetical protein
VFGTPHYVTVTVTALAVEMFCPEAGTSEAVLRGTYKQTAGRGPFGTHKAAYWVQAADWLRSSPKNDAYHNQTRLPHPETG